MVLMLLACAGGRVGAPPPETVWDPENRNTVQMEVIEAYIDSGNCDRALYGISSVRNDGLADPNLDFLQARALLCKGLPGDAVKLLEDQYVRSPERNRLMCLAHMDMGQVDDAVQACGAALKHTPKNTDSERRAELFNNHGFTLAAAGRHDEAAEAFEDALQLDPDFHRARNNYAFSLAAQGHDNLAYDQFLAAQSPSGGIRQAQANAWLNLGLAQQGRGDAEAARESFQNALQLVPDHPRATHALSSLE